MKKIPTMFERDETLRGRPVIDQIKPECQWVLDGEGYATRKYDGQNVKIEGHKLLKRQKPAEGDYDEASYVPAERGHPADKYLFEGYDFLLDTRGLEDGIYEAIGPKIQGNPEKVSGHSLIRVDPPETQTVLSADTPRTFDGLKDYLFNNDIEGIVFHHKDGRMAKIKKRDFAFRR